MIEKQIIMQKMKELKIQEFLATQLPRYCYSNIEFQRTPLGEKIVIYTSRPGIIVGKKGENIKKLTAILKKKFQMENPQIEIGEIPNPYLDVHYVAGSIASYLERFGSKRFKSIGYKTLQNIIDAGALGAEIRIGGRGVPGSRAKSWRFSAGYLKKSGSISENEIKRVSAVANLKSGAIGVKVSIMTPDIQLPDKIKIKTQEKQDNKKTENGTDKKK